MSDCFSRALQIGSALKVRNFVPAISTAVFALCRAEAPARNGMTPPPASLSRYNAAGGQMVQGRRRTMRAILASVILCSALATGDGYAQTEQLKTEQFRTELAAEDIARGKALAEAGDCASCHTADPAKPF